MPFPSPESEPAHAVRGAWLRNFWPAPVGITGRERARIALGAALGVLLAALLARWWSHAHPGGHWMVASLGASAVLVFAMPSSPLAQPWPVLGGNTLSVWVGLACAALVPEPAVAAALAVAAAVLVMVPLRCLHPPGAAMALFVVLNPGEDAHLLLFPVLFNVLVLVLVGIAYNNATGRSYPHPQRPQRDDRAVGAGQFSTAPCASTTGSALICSRRIMAQASFSATPGSTAMGGRDMMSAQRSSPSVRWKAARPAMCSNPARSARLMSSTWL